jgi:predicted negative regulator of RcsB-dependent stress response
MAKHISRKELKKNEFAETMMHGAEAVASHQRLTWIIGGAIALVLILVGGWRYYSQNQTARASVGLQAAMKIFDARIRASGEPAAPDEVTYIDEPGHVALYYEALCLAQLDKNDEAEKDLKAVESSGDASLAPLAQFQLAQVYDNTSRSDQALKIYQQLADKPAEFVPRAVVLLKMADHHSKSNPQEAAKLYNQVKTEFPDSAAAQAADKGLQLLSPAKG